MRAYSGFPGSALGTAAGGAGPLAADRFVGQDVRLRAAAEISMGDRRVSADRSAELDREQPQGAFLAERRDDFDKGRIGPDAPEISDLLAVRLPDEAHRAHPWGWPPLVAAPEAQLVSEPWMQAQLRASPRLDVRSDVQADARLPEVAQSEPPQDAPEHRSEKRLPELPLVPRERATAQPEPQVWRAEVQALARQVSPAPQREPQRVARFSLSPPQPSPLPRQLLPLPDRGNVSAPARRARYQSSSSASSFL